MYKVALLLIKGDDAKVLETFETKEEALKRGDELFKQYTQDESLLSCVATEIDENNNIVKPYRWMCYRSWL